MKVKRTDFEHLNNRKNTRQGSPKLQTPITRLGRQALDKKQYEVTENRQNHCSGAISME